MEYPRGSIVKCNHCDTTLYKLASPLKYGDLVHEILIEEIPPQTPPKNHQRMVCVHCENDFDLSNIESKEE